MHVLILTTEFPPRLVGGLGVVAHQQARHLARRPGVRVTVVTPGPVGRPRWRETSPAYRVLRFPRRRPYARGPCPAPRALARWLVRVPPPDVILAHHPDVLPLVRWWLRRHPVPVVYACHSLLAVELRGATSPRRRRQEALLDLAARVVVGSEEARQQLLRHYPGLAGRAEVIPPGVAVPARGPGPRSRRRILFVGRLSPLKGVTTLLRALPRVLRRHPGARLEIVGTARPSRVRRLRALARRLGVAGRVRLRGWLPPRRLARLYRRVAVVAVPSRSETFGLVGHEALAHGAPLVCTPVGGLRAIPPGAAWKVPPGDAAALARALIDVLAHPARARRRAAAGREWVRRFSWERSAAQLEQLLRTVAGTAGGGSR